WAAPSRRSATSRSTTRSPRTRSAGASPGRRRRTTTSRDRRLPVANEAYRAVFLRVHPTGKMVLSLTTEPDGREDRYAQLVAEELGVPALDVKVVPNDTNRFGTGNGYNT